MTIRSAGSAAASDAMAREGSPSRTRVSMGTRSPRAGSTNFLSSLSAWARTASVTTMGIGKSGRAPVADGIREGMTCRAVTRASKDRPRATAWARALAENSEKSVGQRIRWISKRAVAMAHLRACSVQSKCRTAGFGGSALFGGMGREGTQRLRPSGSEIAIPARSRVRTARGGRLRPLAGCARRRRRRR